MTEELKKEIDEFIKASPGSFISLKGMEHRNDLVRQELIHFFSRKQFKSMSFSNIEVVIDYNRMGGFQQFILILHTRPLHTWIRIDYVPFEYEVTGQEGMRLTNAVVIA